MIFYLTVLKWLFVEWTMNSYGAGVIIMLALYNEINK